MGIVHRNNALIRSLWGTGSVPIPRVPLLSPLSSRTNSKNRSTTFLFNMTNRLEVGLVTPCAFNTLVIPTAVVRLVPLLPSVIEDTITHMLLSTCGQLPKAESEVMIVYLTQSLIAALPPPISKRFQLSSTHFK